MLTIKLSSVGNPDHRQYSPLSPSTTVEIESLEEASKVCLNYIYEYELGGGNWSGGQVYQSGKQVAYVSYNGRVWFGDELKDWMMDDELQ